MHFYAYHGVLEHEALVGNDFEVNLRVAYDFSKAMETDDVEDTLNYADVYDIVKAEMAVPSKLLEHVAGRIFSRLRTTYPSIGRIELRVAKYNPPVDGQVEKSQIEIIDGE